MYAWGLLLLSLVACDDRDAVEPAAPSSDRDGDGFSLDDGDCDDTDGAVHPRAPEVCDGVDNDCDGFIDDDDPEGAEDAPRGHVDADGDGYGGGEGEGCGVVTEGGDCDDGDGEVNPGAVESCDGVDNDCDGLTDEDDAIDAGVWFFDADADGFGDPERSSSACEQPNGYLSEGGDCDDGDADVNPDALEICNAKDDDCDGEIDPDTAEGTSEWLLDSDGDGYGALGASIVACDAPPGYVDDHPARLDCDDTDADIHPGAEELCNGVDDDCDGEIDPPTSRDASTWYADADADGFGASDASVSACRAAAGFVELGSDCDDADADVNPDALEICNAKDDDCDGLVDDSDGSLALATASTWYLDADGDGLGDASAFVRACEPPAGYVEGDTDCDDADASVYDPMSWYPDADGDGYGDADAPPTLSCGEVSGAVVDQTDCDDSDPDAHPGGGESLGDDADGDCDGHDSQLSASEADVTILGEEYQHMVGFAVAGDGDVDGDGLSDLLIGAYGENSDAADAGAAYLVVGAELQSGQISRGAHAHLSAEASGDFAGYAVGVAGDADGDGLSDLLIGANYESSAATQAGATYLVSSPVSGALSLSDADAKLEGVAYQDRSGSAVAFAGDADGDGFDDLLIGAYGEDSADSNAGAAYLVMGPVSGDLSLSDAELIFTGESSGDYAGHAVAGAGDVDGDGLADLLVGAKYADPSGRSSGTAYLLLGANLTSGTLSLADADARFTGDGEDAHAGNAVSGAGDMDGDGLDDLLIGEPGASEVALEAGAAYLFWGAVSGDTPLSDADARALGEALQDYAGWSLSEAGDVDGDGFADLLIGAYGDAHAASGAGAAYLVLGPMTGALSLAEADAKFIGEGSYHYLGYDVASAGDVDGDGLSDLLLGAWGDDTYASRSGVVYLALGGELDW